MLIMSGRRRHRYVNRLLLIHSNSTDGSQVFQDSSNIRHTIVAGGHVHHEVDQKYFGATSIHFDGTTDTLRVTDTDADWAFGTGDFTIDMWIRVDLTASRGIIGNGYNTNNIWHLRVTDAGVLTFSYGSGLGYNGGTAAIVANTWTHIAIERHGNSLDFYANGTKGTTRDLTGIDFSGLADLYIGNGFGGPNDYLGYMDEIRILNTADYGGANFTPEPSPYAS